MIGYGTKLSIGRGFRRCKAARVWPSKPPPWTPPALGVSLFAWWDAERSDKITQSGSLSSAWADIIGPANLMQGTTSRRPVVQMTGFNGRPCLYYDGVDDVQTTNANPGNLPLGTGVAFEVWGLAENPKVQGVGPGGAFFSFGNGNNDGFSVGMQTSGSNSQAYARIGSGASSTTVVQTATQFVGRRVIRVSVGATSSFIEVDGVAGSASSFVPSMAWQNMQIGANYSWATPMECRVNSILITAPLEAEKAAALRNFLSARKDS